MASLFASVALIGGRAAISLYEPTTAGMVPFLVMAPLLLTWELIVYLRRNRLLRPADLDRAAAAWCTVAVFSLLVSALDGSPQAPATLQMITRALLTWSILAASAVGLAASALGRCRAGIVRWTAVAVGAGVAIAALPGAYESVRWWLPVSATIGVVANLSSRFVRNSVRRSRNLALLVLGGASAFRDRTRLVFVRACRVPGRSWCLLLRSSSPREVPGRRRVGRRDRVGAAVMAMCSASYLAVSARWAHQAGWQPTAHAATLLARASQVGTQDHPLVGLVSSFASGTAAHPSPLVMDLLAPFIWVFGLQNGALVGATLTALVVWSVAVWSAWRAGGGVAAAGAWVAGLLVLEVAGLGAVWEANNISISYLPMLAAILASWAASTGTWRAWWWAVALGSFCVGSYLPHGMVVIGPVVWSGLALAGARRSTDDPAVARQVGRALRVGYLIFVVAWVQPALDVVLNQGGNVRALGAEMVASRPQVGPAGFPQAIAWVLAVPPRWGSLTGSFAQPGTAAGFIGGVGVSGVAVAIGLVYLCWRTRRSTLDNERQLRIITVLVLLGVGVNGTQLPPDFLHSFQLVWLVVASLFVWFVVGTSCALAAQRRIAVGNRARWGPIGRIAAAGIAVVAVVVAGAAGPQRIEDIKGRRFTVDAMISPLVDQTVESLPTKEPILVLRLDTLLNDSTTDTVLANLIVRGMDARVEDDGRGLNYGRRRIVTRWSGPMLWITSGVDPVKPDGERLARASMPGWSQRRFDELADQVGRRAAGSPVLELEPWAQSRLPLYLAGWLSSEDVCSTAKGLRRGDLAAVNLPRGLLLTLYADDAVLSPRLPASLQEDAAAIVGQAPVEVFLTERNEDGPISSGRLLRDGSQCERESAGP